MSKFTHTPFVGLKFGVVAASSISNVYDKHISINIETKTTKVNMLSKYNEWLNEIEM